MESLDKNGREAGKSVRIIKTIVLALVLGLAGTIFGETFTIELPELVGNLQPYPNGATAPFDFGTTFLQIDQVSIRMKGTNTPFSFPEIEAYMDPGVGSCYTYLHPLDSPFDVEDTFSLKYGATWNFLLDGKGEVSADLIWPVGPLDQILDNPPTVEISEAYLTVEGVVPEPSTFCFLSLGGLWIARKLVRK